MNFFFLNNGPVIIKNIPLGSIGFLSDKSVPFGGETLLLQKASFQKN
jgi:hypothetical protein